MPSAIFSCSCVQNFQDTRYGKNNRVFNSTMTEDKWRCTICLFEKIVKGTNRIVTNKKKKN